MLTRDHYIVLLEKRAYDAQSQTEKDIAALQKDDREYLGPLFKNTSEVQKQQSKAVGKLFPGGGKNVTKESGNPLLKVARAALEGVEPHYAEVALRSFQDEIEKIAAVKGTTASELSARNATAQSFGKTWHLPDPDAVTPRASMGAATQKIRSAVARPGSGTSVAGKGLMSRIGGLFGKTASLRETCERLGYLD